MASKVTFNINLCFLLFSCFYAFSTAITANEAVTRGINYFRTECTRQQLLMPELLKALQLRDYSRAKTAYVAARPPYEQIETLANAYPKLDADIDARPYAFPLGEDSPMFRGFHVIERALYRDQLISDAVVKVAMRLVTSVDRLCGALNNRKTFNPYITFDGAIALAFEIPAKKVASEEETWSDLSLMIFRNNYQGIWSQVSPFFDTGFVTTASKKTLETTYRAIQNVMNKIDPMNDFFTSAGTARAYSSVSTGERKMIVDGAYAFATALEAVRDQVLDNVPPSEEEEEEEEEEEGDMVNNDKYKSQTIAVVRYFLSQCRKQQMLVSQLGNAIRSGNLFSARKVYERTRPPYEQIEVLAADFEELDGFIDQRPYAVERGELDDDWRGFHQIERSLFRDNNLTAAAQGIPLVKQAVDDLCVALQEGVNGGGSFTASRSFDGMIVLSYEVSAKKISSEEETWSDLSVMIFRENLKGIYAVFEPFMNVLPKKVGMDVKMAFNDIRSLIKYTIDTKNDFDNGYNFIKYSKVPFWFRKEFSDKFYVLGRSLRRAKNALAKK